jgi:hypothetical protein
MSGADRLLSRIDVMKPRTHHFQAKYLLVQMALQSTAKFFARFAPGGDPQYLPHLWTALGLELEPAERIPNEGIAMWHQPAHAGVAETLVLTLPRPEVTSEAYFIGVIRMNEDACRVFCLERSSVPPTNELTTILSEFARNGRMNWGPGSEATIDAFVALMRNTVADESARPMSIIPMRLA